MSSALIQLLSYCPPSAFDKASADRRSFSGGWSGGHRMPAMPVVSITRLRVRSWRYLPQFFIRTLLIARQAGRSAGNLAVTLLRDRHNTFWTGTIWSDEAAIKTFMHAAPHGPAMRKLLEWCDEASLVGWI